MKFAKSLVDMRPFRSKAEDQSEQSLHAKYRPLAIPGLLAAVALMSRKGDRPAGGR